MPLSSWITAWKTRRPERVGIVPRERTPCAALVFPTELPRRGELGQDLGAQGEAGDHGELEADKDEEEASQGDGQLGTEKRQQQVAENREKTTQQHCPPQAQAIGKESGQAFAAQLGQADDAGADPQGHYP